MRKGNAADFARRITYLAEGIPEEAARIVRRVALAVDQAVVMATPVDTGRARANWIVGIDKIPTHWRQPERTKTGHAVPGAGAAAARKAIVQANLEISRYKYGQTIYIANNVPYIGELNRGSSAQAPAGFVEKAVAIGENIARAARLLRKR